MPVSEFMERWTSAEFVELMALRKIQRDEAEREK